MNVVRKFAHLVTPSVFGVGAAGRILKSGSCPFRL